MGCQTEQIMVAKFQILMFLFANAEVVQATRSGYFPSYVH
jgi:hypothetical protein